MRSFSNVIGFDDAPFARDHRGNVLVVGAVFSGLHLEGVLSGQVRRDGANATRTIAAMVAQSRFAEQTQAIMLQGIAMAGFNVIDIHALYRQLDVPVLVVARKAPDMQAVRNALLSRVRGGKRKWSLIERAGPMQPVSGVFVQLAGLDIDEAEAMIGDFAVNGLIPEPLRTAHLIAGGIADGESRGRT